ncbi:outer membrane protein assembly factor BamB family protein [Niabella aquatica]
MRADNKFFVLSNGRVAAIDKKSGEIAWEVKLRQYTKASLSYAVGQIVLEGDKLIIGVSGILFCLSARDGSLIWKNELKGWGYAFISIANTNPGASAQDHTSSAAAMAGTIAATSAAAS